MGQKAVRRFQENFTAETYAANFQELYRQVVAEGTRTLTEGNRAMLLSLMEVYQSLRQKEQQQHEIANLLSSTSWKMTKPVRSLSDVCRGMKGRLRR